MWLADAELGHRNGPAAPALYMNARHAWWMCCTCSDCLGTVQADVHMCSFSYILWLHLVGDSICWNFIKSETLGRGALYLQHRHDPQVVGPPMATGWLPSTYAHMEF